MTSLLAFRSPEIVSAGTALLPGDAPVSSICDMDGPTVDHFDQCFRVEHALSTLVVVVAPTMHSQAYDTRVQTTQLSIEVLLGHSTIATKLLGFWGGWTLAVDLNVCTAVPMPTQLVASENPTQIDASCSRASFSRVDLSEILIAVVEPVLDPSLAAVSLAEEGIRGRLSLSPHTHLSSPVSASSWRSPVSSTYHIASGPTSFAPDVPSVLLRIFCWDDADQLYHSAIFIRHSDSLQGNDLSAVRVFDCHSTQCGPPTPTTLVAAGTPEREPTTSIAHWDPTIHSAAFTQLSYPVQDVCFLTAQVFGCCFTACLRGNHWWPSPVDDNGCYTPFDHKSFLVGPSTISPSCSSAAGHFAPDGLALDVPTVGFVPLLLRSVECTSFSYPGGVCFSLLEELRSIQAIRPSVLHDSAFQPCDPALIRVSNSAILLAEFSVWSSVLSSMVVAAESDSGQLLTTIVENDAAAADGVSRSAFFTLPLAPPGLASFWKRISGLLCFLLCFMDDLSYGVFRL